MSIDYTGKNLILESSNLEAGKVKWQSPSNIALVKYWGKFGNQLPRNPSISFTLTESYTETEIEYSEKIEKGNRIELEYLFNGQENEAFTARVKKYFHELLPIFPFLQQLSFKINSRNTFPHSAGIASSASAMSALALGLCSLEDRFFGSLAADDDYERKASYVARLGSGSACRSIFAQAAMWGRLESVPASSDEYAIPMKDGLHELFQDYRDSILMVSRSVKSVSSSAGHQLMDTHPYASVRYAEARKNCNSLLSVLRNGDLERFVEIVETEAFQLHALMMMSSPSYVLMEPGTLAIIGLIRQFRHDTGIPIAFTLDAGPNIHLLYPAKYLTEVELFIEEELLTHCEQRGIIKDKVGAGPLEI